MVHLPSNPDADSIPKRISRNVKKFSRKSSRAIMKSHSFKIPVVDMPIRLRPWFLVFTFLIMTILAFLGFTNFARALPLNDKLLHFFCLGIATGVFFFIFDVEEDARRIWYWRRAPLIITGVTCFFFGGIVSEIVQSMLPYKEFDMGDILANLLGSSVGLYISYYLEKYYRHRREISRLYRPLDAEPLSDDEEQDDLESATQLLPTHQSQSKPTQSSTSKPTRFGNVWDEREELFNVGGDSDEEDDDDDEPLAHRSKPK